MTSTFNTLLMEEKNIEPFKVDGHREKHRVGKSPTSSMVVFGMVARNVSQEAL